MQSQTPDQELSGYDRQLSENEMLGVYMALSVPEDSNIDDSDAILFVRNCIEECFTKSFLMISTESLQNNPLLLNQKFIELIKFCAASKFKRVGYIFIEFCDYFDLDNNKVYTALAEKLQLMIKYSAKCLCGGEKYENVRKKHAEQQGDQRVNVVTLFSLVNNQKTSE